VAFRKRELIAESDESVIQSLLTKAAMLTAAMSLILWFGWSIPEQQNADDSGSRLVSSDLNDRISSPDVAGKSITREAKQTSVSSNQLEVAQFQTPATPTLPLDLNTSTVQQLKTLPGIGPKLAQRIIEFRDKNGPFRIIEELQEVKGIGERRLEQLRPLITAKQGTS